MRPLTTLHLTLLSVLLATITTLRGRTQRIRTTSRDTGLSTLEITILALGLFLVAGVAVVALTGAVNNRLSQIQ